MPDKGNVMSQTHYEKQNKLLKLIQESFDRDEMNVKEAVTALRLIGFSETIAANRVSDWKLQFNGQVPETQREKRRRLKEQASLEKHLLRARLGKKKYEEYMKLLAKYKSKQLSKDETIAELMQFGYSRKFAECTVERWEGWEEEYNLIIYNKKGGSHDQNKRTKNN